MPTLPFMRSFNNMMVNICKLNHIDDYNKQLENALNDKISELETIKRDRERKIKDIKQRIEDKKMKIELKKAKIQEVKGSLTKIDKFAQEKQSDGKYYQEVLKAFNNKLADD